jgi:hypothetical protein
MDTGRTVKRAVLPSPVISDIPAGRAPCEWTAGSDNGGLYTGRCVRATCFSWPEGRALVSLHDARPGYWIHWIPRARHDNGKGSTVACEHGWLLRTRQESVTELGTGRFGLAPPAHHSHRN